ncbi:MAG: hypothetical protein Q9195_007237 [Heterodermia aff. obscurata]
MVSLTIPKKVLQTDSSLLRALEEDSEVLQNITDQFAPLQYRYRVFFFWEQERTDLKYTKDYIVDEASAAPILDDTERSGIAADHCEMCRFDRKDSPGFRTVIAALKRYCDEAPGVVRVRQRETKSELDAQRWSETQQLLRGISENTSPPESGNSGLPLGKRGLSNPLDNVGERGWLPQAILEDDTTWKITT